MINYYVRHSRGESFTKVSTQPSTDVWVSGDMVEAHELRHVADKYGLDYNVLVDVLDKSELPRVEVKNGTMYVFVRTARRLEHGEVVTTPLLLAVKGSVFVSLSTTTYTEHKLAAGVLSVRSSDTISLLLGTFATVVSGYEQLILRTGRYIHDIRERLHSHEVSNKDFIHFVTVEDNLNEYKLNLTGMQVVAERLRETMKPHDREALDDIMLYIRQLTVAIQSHNQSITSIRNAYSTIANNTLNQRMKTLTVLTVLIALPNVFYGMYGMNVDLPFQHEPWAYALVVVFTLGLVLLAFALAKRFRVF